ncbi:hypothetical protein QAD02_020583 [Eretmocerus hayati]|uniref:Uncharacterized protein n=1 Tax=Eretmocerus hayati TaxID=131215 RepID=A0ACC2PMG8_9HYME|nr:hypothetical protein QAD02_020583 [Eretmocerus hayati]
MSQRHSEWHGFDEIPPEVKGEESRPECLLCHAILTEKDSAFMKTHRKTCEELLGLRWVPLGHTYHKRLERIFESLEEPCYNAFADHGMTRMPPSLSQVMREQPLSRRAEVSGMHHQRSRSAESCCSWRGTTQDRSPEFGHLDSFNDESEDSSPHPQFFHDSRARDLHIRHESASSHDDCELSDTDTSVSSRQLREHHLDEELSPPSSPLQGDDATPSSPELPQSASTANRMWERFDADETLPLPGSSSPWHDGGTPPSHRPRPGSRAAQFQGSHTPSRQASRRLRVDSPGGTCNKVRMLRRRSVSNLS